MIISTEIGSAASKIGDRKAIEYYAKAGFDAWDFSMSDRERFCYPENKVLGPDGAVLSSNLIRYARELKKIGLDNGIYCNQSHAPFPSVRPEIKDTFKTVIEMTAEAGGKICVIHPCNNWSDKDNAEMYREFLPFAKAHGVKIATENMWNWDNEKDEALPAACCDSKRFCSLIDEVDDEYFVACLDIGHAEMRGLNASAVGLIKALGHKRLKALHIHDNDLHYDSHQIPMSMSIDFNAVVKALKEIGYDGEFTLEADRYLGAYSCGDIFTGMKKLAESARMLANMFESL